MSIGRIIDAEGNVTEIERPTWESVLDAYLESDMRRASDLERNLALLDGVQHVA